MNANHDCIPWGPLQSGCVHTLGTLPQTSLVNSIMNNNLDEQREREREREGEGGREGGREREANCTA